jgi:co-chaperonin GroES (HSP10)
MKLIALEDFVAVKMLDAKSKTPGGIVLPDEVRKPKLGRVHAIGPGRYEGNFQIPMTLSIGDLVVCPPYSNEVEVDGETFRMYRQADIAARLEE